MSEQQPEVCLCAAVRLPDGYIVRGHRHNDCLRTVLDMKRACSRQEIEQGFLTTRGRFVDRLDGLRLQLEAGIAPARGFYQNQLYSEDLY